MNDPHVVALYYRVVETDSFKFKDPSDIDFETSDFRAHLSNNVLTLKPTQHFDSVAQIRPITDKFVQGWEIDAGLNYGRPDFRFRFEGSQIVDRASAPGVVAVDSTEHIHVSDTVHVSRLINVYPIPPIDFQITLEVELFWNRYCRFLEDKEPLLSMAYSCLTFLERDRSRKAAAQHYGIEFDLLNKLGDLTANKGDKLTARKFLSITTPLTSKEQAWIKSAIKAIIRHLATHRSGEILKMSDLPLVI